jgi:chaperonin cofactor prefoldin
MALTLQQRLQAASEDFEKLQLEHSLAVDTRQRLEAQLAENEAVKKVRTLFHCPDRSSIARAQEFDQLTPENTIYKLVGPVLVKQDQEDAKSNVGTRLEFIRGEMLAFSFIVVHHSFTRQSASESKLNSKISDPDQKKKRKR